MTWWSVLCAAREMCGTSCASAARAACGPAQGDTSLSRDTSRLAPDRLVCAMTAAGYTRLLVPLAALVFVGGWVLAAVAFFVIGTRTCANVQVPLAGTLQ